MKLKELNEKIDTLEKSPIRQYLHKNHSISLFEDEKKVLSEIDKIVNANKENLKSSLKVVILGEVKAGKSTLVNALIGKKVTYTNVVEATATIIEIKYSNEEHIIIKYKSGETIELYSINELNKLMDEKRENQEFFTNIDKVAVFTNTQRLKEITLVDTPGLNTVTRENAERTENYIANANVILWILSAHHLGQSDVIEKIEEVLEYGKPIICVLNRIDEINGDISELVDYVDNEMGYMFEKVFATSAKIAWDGFIENDESKVKQSNINELYDYMVNNFDRKTDQVQFESILESLNVQIKRDLEIHKKIKHKLIGISGKINEDLKELSHYNIEIKQIISNKLSEWIETKFFKDEELLLINCVSNQQFINAEKKYIDDTYIQKLINKQYEELGHYILDEWRNRTEKFLRIEEGKKITITDAFNSYSIIENEKLQEDKEIIEGVKQGTITASAVGLGLAGYAAWLGPAAAYISIGSAVSAIFPPVLIAGVLGGVAWKLMNKGKIDGNRHSQVKQLVFNLKGLIKNNVISDIKNNLYESSDKYYQNSSLMIMSILQQCNTSKAEIEEINNELDNYIYLVEQYISKG